MPFADDLIGEHTARMLIRAIAATVPGAPLTALCAAAGNLASRRLGERSDLLRDALLADLPGGYASLAGTIRRAARAGHPPLRGWLIRPVTSAVAARAVALETALRWLGAPDGNTTRVIGRGLRTLVKRGHRDARELLGRCAASPVEVAGLGRRTRPAGACRS